MGKFEKKEFTLCDEDVKIKATVEEIIGSMCNRGLSRYEVTMAVYELLGEYMSYEDRDIIMDKIKELI